MEFSETEDFEIVQALKIKNDCSQDRCIWCFAVDPDNLEHWRYFFENSFVKLQNDNLYIFNGAAEVPEQEKNPSKPSVKTDSLESSIKDEAASSHSFLSSLSQAQCIKRYGKGVCWGFQRQVCKNQLCILPHRCSCCNSEDHGFEACPIIRSSMAKFEPKIEKLNNKKKIIVDESLTPLELAEMLGAVDNDGTELKGRNALDKSNRRRRQKGKGLCFAFQRGTCVRGKNCMFKHRLRRDSWDHGRLMCRSVQFQTKRLLKLNKRKRYRKRKQERLRNKYSFQPGEVKRKARKKSSIGTNPLIKSAIRPSSVCVKREGMQKLPKPEV